MSKLPMRKKIAKVALIVVALIAIVLVAGIVYVKLGCHPAGQAARAALRSDDVVTVTEYDDHFLFDGPGTGDAMIFYPGAMVDPEAYAPLMRALAVAGIDCFLTRPPLDLAILDGDAAAGIIDPDAYERWYVGGHSMGGMMAGGFAAEHPDLVDGLMMCAAYTIEDLSDRTDIPVLSIWGTSDGVLNIDRMRSETANLPANFTEVVIKGGNHAQFGDYGDQPGDNPASISASEQVEATVSTWCALINPLSEKTTG